jgi:MSHA biogenesis protein MshO
MVIARDMRPTYKSAHAGFTLVEMITVIAIMGIVAAAVAGFIRVPMQLYQDAQRRASITDAANTAFALLKRDLQNSLPNSVRVTLVGAVYHLEFLQTRTGGRYRAADSNPSASWSANHCPDGNANSLAEEDVLQFGVADTCFTSLGGLAHLATVLTGSDFLAIYNLGSGFANADAYASGAATGGNKSLITSVAAGSGGANVISFSSNTFNLESPGRRFHVISGPVSYACDPGAGTLNRYSGYAITAAQQTPPPGTPALLARGVTGCTIVYDQNVINQRQGVVSIWLRIAATADPGGGAVNLFQQVQVSNVP